MLLEAGTSILGWLHPCQGEKITFRGGGSIVFGGVCLCRVQLWPPLRALQQELLLQRCLQLQEQVANIASWRPPSATTLLINGLIKRSFPFLLAALTVGPHLLASGPESSSLLLPCSQAQRPQSKSKGSGGRGFTPKMQNLSRLGTKGATVVSVFYMKETITQIFFFSFIKTKRPLGRARSAVPHLVSRACGCLCRYYFSGNAGFS